MPPELPETSVAEALAAKIAALPPGVLPAVTSRKCEDLLIDVVGLCITARNEDYVRSGLAGCDDDGPCTAIGHARTMNAAGAAFVNGTAAHGEDFDDTFEGGPVHAGAVVVPAVLEGVQPQVAEVGRLGVPPDAEDAAHDPVRRSRLSSSTLRAGPRPDGSGPPRPTPEGS